MRVVGLKFKIEKDSPLGDRANSYPNFCGAQLFCDNVLMIRRSRPEDGQTLLCMGINIFCVDA